MKQILSEEFRRMQKLAGIVNENEEKYPKSITVKLTDKLKKEKKIYQPNDIIKMNPGIKYNLGVTTSKPTEEGEIYFGEYFPNIGEISVNSYVIPVNKVGKTEWFLYLEKKDELYPSDVENIQNYVEKGELKNVPDFDCSFRENKYEGTKGFVVGAQDNRGYFEIVEID